MIIRPVFKQFVAVIAVNLIILCVGMEAVWTSPALVKLRDPAETPLSRPITQDEGGWIVSIGYMFCIFTIPCVGVLVHNFGRKQCILMASLPKIIASLFTIYATEVWMLLVTRAVNATMSSAITLLTTIYSAEIANKEIRGSLGSIVSIFSCFGSFLMLGIGPYISYLNLNILLTAVTVCACIPLLLIPDTPYSLYKKGSIREAKNVLIFFRGSETLAEEEMKEFSQIEPKQHFDKREIFKNKTYRKAFIIVIIMGIGVQFNGFYFILPYLQTILELTNTSITPPMCSLIIGLIQILASMSSGILCDKFGRKPIIITTSLGVAVGMIGIGGFFAFKQHGTNISGFLNFLPVISIALISCCHSGGVGSVYLVLITELLDDKTRAIGASTSILAATASVFLLSKYSMEILSAIGNVATFVMFAGISISISIFVFIFVPETKHKTFTDIQKALEGLKDKEERKDCVTKL